MNEEVEALRREIDAADDAIAAALSRRFALTDRMRALKAELKLAPVDADRERKIIERVFAATPLAHHDTVFSIYERILGGSRGMIETIARGVCIFEGKLLVCRAKGAKTCYLPGGHIEFGETGAEALVREVKEELGVESAAGEMLGALENSFLQHGRPHSEINLVYRLELKNCVPAAVAAVEPWIEFEWVPLAELGSAKLLPTEIEKFLSEK